MKFTFDIDGYAGPRRVRSSDRLHRWNRRMIGLVGELTWIAVLNVMFYVFVHSGPPRCVAATTFHLDNARMSLVCKLKYFFALWE